MNEAYATNSRRTMTLAGFAVGVLMSGALALMARGIIDHVTLYDELLHLLSARGLLATGKPVIAEGLYERAELFTRFVAWSLGHFGSTPVAARLPALAFAMLLTVLLTTWVSRRTNVLGGLAAAAIWCLLPTTIELAVFARFYTLHALVVMALVILVYEASEARRSVRFRVICGVATLPLLAIGLHLQETTAIVVGALGTGVMAVLISDHWPFVRGILQRYPLQVTGSIAGLVIVGLFAANFLGLVERLGQAPLWAVHAAHRPYYYLIAFADSTPFLWPVFPVIAVLAYLFYPRLSLFCLAALAFVFIVHSVAAQKSLRYMFYAFPLVCVLWGAAIAGLPAWLRRRQSTIPTALIAGTLLLVVAVPLATSLEGRRAVKLLSGRLPPHEALGYAVEADWRSALSVLQPLAASTDRIMTSNAMKSIFYLGRYDYELNASIVGETDTTQEFGRDERTGMKAIGALESVKKVLDMPGTTLVVLERETMNLDSGVSASAAAEIAGRCAPVEVPATAEVGVWKCTHP